MTDNCVHSAAPDICAGVVNKCLSASRVKTQKKGMEILLLFIELEKTDIVMEELIKGLSAKQPKIVLGSFHTVRSALS